MSVKLNVPNAPYETTVRRLARLQGQLSTRPRAERLKDKVCIVTGVGSLKGIGYVLFSYQQVRHPMTRCVQKPRERIFVRA